MEYRGAPSGYGEGQEIARVSVCLCVSVYAWVCAEREEKERAREEKERAREKKEKARERESERKKERAREEKRETSDRETATEKGRGDTEDEGPGKTQGATRTFQAAAIGTQAERGSGPTGGGGTRKTPQQGDGVCTLLNYFCRRRPHLSACLVEEGQQPVLRGGQLPEQHLQAGNLHVVPGLAVDIGQLHTAWGAGGGRET